MKTENFSNGQVFFYRLLIAVMSVFNTSLLADNSSAWQQYKDSAFEIHAQIPGWCNREKAALLMDLVLETQPVLCIEIGTFAGATTFPLLCGLNYLGRGLVYAIDAWDHQIATEGLNLEDPLLHQWNALNINMDAVYYTFLNWIAKLEFNQYCTPLRLKSHQAVSLFSNDSIDLLYIDGNGSKHGSLQDVMLYLPKVKKGGYILLNADSRNKNLATGFLMQHCEWIKEKSIGIQFLTFKKRANST